jgi:hypothetical protein
VILLRLDYEQQSSGFFRITNYGDFSTGRTRHVLDNLFKPPRHFAAVGRFAALIAYARRHIFDNNNASARVGGKGREAILYITFAHKTNHIKSIKQYIKGVNRVQKKPLRQITILFGICALAILLTVEDIFGGKRWHCPSVLKTNRKDLGQGFLSI